MHLVIVESPTKAKTIRKFLGPEFTVLASMGHIRDLPQSADEVPESLKKTPVGRLGVDVEHDFAPLYVIPDSKAKTIREMKTALKTAEDVYLATDEDREGESISWHLLSVLKPTVPVYRMVFHEITAKAINEALKNTRSIDDNLVHAQEVRRILDRLVGYTLSPILWKKIAFGLSAGRVQSAALKAIVDRERARMAFNKAGYWDVTAALKHAETEFKAQLVATKGQKIATGKDFDEATGQLKKDSTVVQLDETCATQIAGEAKTSDWTVEQVTKKPTTRKPPAPFITSTLQQESNRKLGLSSKETMRAAQTLYEKGHITYMRTDSVNLSAEAVTSARKHIESRFGAEFLTPAPRTYASTKGAQEAHEAIRPSLTFAAPDSLDVTPSERDVYELIWMRTLASQMKDSEQLQVAVTMKVGEHTFQSNGMTIIFPGFLRAYAEAEDDPEQALDDRESRLPELTNGDKPKCEDATAQSHETKPPARFTEAGLIQYMEKEGIGRPSTYATVISTLLGRNYVYKQANALVPTFTGMTVTKLMENHFGDLVDAKFTSHMEQSLDKIAEGKEEWLPYLKHFFLGEKGLLERAKTEGDKIDPIEARTMHLPKLPDVTVHIGKYGAFFEATHPRSGTAAKASVPVDMAPADFDAEAIDKLLKSSQQGPTTLGQDPATGEYIFLKTGSYGPYLQLGDDPPEGSKDKPKRVSVPENIPVNTLDHDKAVALLSLPRRLGAHPTDGKDIVAGLGKFGPYVKHETDFRSLKPEDDLFTVTLERALELLAQPKGTRGGAKVLRTVGPHPKDQRPITLHEGKFGIYIKYGTVNATLPKDANPETFTVEEAVALLEARKKAKKLKG